MGQYKKISDRKHIAILDLGCGEGGNMRFLQKEGFNVVGLDGSLVALQKNKCITKSENMNYKLVNANFAQLPFKSESFDCVVDIASLQHNTFSNISLIVNQIYDFLKKEGFFFSFCLRKGSYFTSRRYTHFFARNEISRAYRRFSNVSLDKAERTFNNGKYCWKYWIVSVQK